MKDQIFGLLTEIKVDIAEIRKDVSNNTKSLDYHIRRTNLLEDCLEEHQSKRHLFVKDIVTTITVISMILGMAFTLLRIFG